MTRRRTTRRRKKSGKGGNVLATSILVLTLGLVAVFAGSAVLRLARERGASGREALSASAGTPDPTHDRSLAAHSQVSVEIWNGSGSQGAGQKVAEALKDGGFKVGEVRNADRSDYGATLVVDRKGNRRAAEEVLKYLHGGYPLVMRSATASADVRVVVGRDQEGLRLNP